MVKKNKNILKIILGIIVGILILFSLFSFLGKQYISFLSQNSNSQNNNVQYATSISDVKIEFIPSSISGINCEAGKTCVINFQVKNVGNKRIDVSPGTSEDNYDMNNNVNYFSVGSQNSAYLSPGETSQTLNVNAFAKGNLDEGDYQIKIPLQAYDESGHWIGESNYYLIGVVHYSNLPYCCSEQQIESGYCGKIMSVGCRALSCEKTNNLSPCYDY